MYRGKKALSTSFLLAIIVAVITLIVLLFVGSSFMERAKSSADISSCQTFFTTITGEAAFFGESKNTFTTKFDDLIAAGCPASSQIVTKKNVENIASAIQKCWAKSSGGEDILSGTTGQLSLCLYCGDISIKGDIAKVFEELDTAFKEGQFSSLFESKKTVTLNKVLLSKDNGFLPTELRDGERYGLLFYIHKTSVPNADESWNFLSSDEEPFTKELAKNYLDSYILKTSVNAKAEEELATLVQTSGTTDRSVSGVFLFKLPSGDTKEISEQTLPVKGCHVIIPKEIRDLS
ncbi:MAG: hypothetical protein H6500_00475 [Candidatus Woesearchaeota archaeon]|nr:hypothetical protein [Nanoarchaeota archaeon]USN44308.1 MAG: hypothetical protein H6500_00475 [Candidatus Woesearchaeota archaeon]